MVQAIIIVLFVITKLGAWVACTLGLKAVTSNYWTYTDSYYAGLWKQCPERSTLTCQTMEATASLNAVRAFVIMGIVFGFIGTIAYSSGFWNRRAIRVAQAGYGFIYFGALCWTVAMIVYSVTYGAESVAWGYSYAFGWACSGLLNFAGGFAHASVSKQQQQISEAA